MIPFVLITLSIVAFFLSKAVPQDPAVTLVQLNNIDDVVIDPFSDPYRQAYQELHLDKPDFYFSIQPKHYPKNINAIFPKVHDPLARVLAAEGYSRREIACIINSPRKKELLASFSLSSTDRKIIEEILNPTILLPTLKWYGVDNQYHLWLKNFFSGNFGNSNVTGKPVWQSVLPALQFTLTMSVIAIVITFILGIYLGYFLAQDPKGKKQEYLSNFLFLLYSIPVFWLATLVVIFFTTDDYGSWTNIFPSIGIDIKPGASTPSLIFSNLEKFILPIVCLLTYVVVYIARMLRRSMLDEMSQPYITTAYSKGLTKNEVLKKHALPNAMLPIITILIGSLSRAISGSVVLEVIFNIPGMGRLLYNAIGLADWNIVFCIIMLTGVMTVVAYIIGDILYAYLDPRVRYRDEST